MRKSLPAVAACALAVAFGAAPDDAAAVDILRGTDSESVAAAHTARSAVNIVRGGGAPAGQPPAPATGDRAVRYAVHGGGVLWLVEPRTGLLTACAVRGTSMAGRSRIHCTAGYLP